MLKNASQKIHSCNEKFKKIEKYILGNDYGHAKNP